MFGPVPMAVIRKLGCQVPQTFEGTTEIKAIVLTVDTGLCRLVPQVEARHKLVDPNGICGVVLTERGRDELTVDLNARREGARRPPYRCQPLMFSRVRHD